MFSFLRRLFGRSKTTFHDPVSDPFTPLPPGASSINWGEWLQQEDPPLPMPRPNAERVAGATAPSMQPARAIAQPVRKLRNTLRSLAQYLTEEEISIIRRQAAQTR